MENTTNPETDHATSPARRSLSAMAFAGAAALIAFVGLVALGTWQVHRLAWKLDLIARVEQRVAAAPVSPPAPPEWQSVTAANDAYRHVRAQGRFLDDRETLVQAVTDLGAGYWVMAAFRTDTGFTLLVNRGFVPTELRNPASRRAGEVHGDTAVTGLLRLTEPGGAFLRSNDAKADRWYSRDVAAIAAARDLGDIAPYFIDADATPNPGSSPVGGLTVIAFPNNHLVYAITWYALAALLAGAAVWAVRDEWRGRRANGTKSGIVMRRHGRPCAGHPRRSMGSLLEGWCTYAPLLRRRFHLGGVDGRHKAGHDEHGDLAPQ